MRGKAELRATRETLGLTQARMADLMGVRVASVKRWESPEQPQVAPDEAWDILDEMCERQEVAVAAALDLVDEVTDERGEPPQAVVVPYWSSQADYDAHHYVDDGGTWTEANATSRRVAASLWAIGVDVRWVDGADNLVERIDEKPSRHLKLV